MTYTTSDAKKESLDKWKKIVEALSTWAEDCGYCKLAEEIVSAKEDACYGSCLAKSFCGDLVGSNGDTAFTLKRAAEAVIAEIEKLPG